jgi:predicted amidophosphoribosyltransferase
MHYELCRKCGGELANWSLCSECRKPIKRICVKCGFHTDEIIHRRCFYHMESIQTQNPIGFSSVEIDSEIRI